MLSSKIYPFPYTKNKSKEFCCRCYVVKLALYFSFFIFTRFQCLCCISCCVKNWNYFFRWLASLWWTLEKATMSNFKFQWWFLIKKLLRLFLASPTQRTHLESFWVLYREFLSINVSKIENSVRNCFSFALLSNYW